MEIRKIRFPVTGGMVRRNDGKEYGCTHIECSVSYSLGGVNIRNYRNDPRGYYAHVTPVRLLEGGKIRASELGSGMKFLLVGCKRQSSKCEAMAAAKFDSEVWSYVEAAFDTKNICKEFYNV